MQLEEQLGEVETVQVQVIHSTKIWDPDRRETILDFGLYKKYKQGTTYCTA